MTIPSAVNYPASLDDDDTLFGNPVDQITLTLATDMGLADTTVEVDEAIDNINLPTLLVFNTGEVVFATSSVPATKTFTVERSLSIGHTNGEAIRLSVSAEYIKQIKRALLAIETELGTDPAGTFTNVKGRLDAIDAVSPEKTLVLLKVVAETSPLIVSDGVISWTVPSELNGAELINVASAVYTSSSSGLPTVDITKNGATMLDTLLTIDISPDKNSYQAATPAVINASTKIVATGDIISVNVDVTGTGTKGLDVTLTLSL